MINDKDTGLILVDVLGKLTARFLKPIVNP